MFGPPGHAYVYFTYGMHFCVNLVCLPEGTASAVLLRAGRVDRGRAGAGRGALAGRPAAAARGRRDLARGPARLCQALAIDRAQNGADACDPASPLRVCAAGPRAGPPAGDQPRARGSGCSRGAPTSPGGSGSPATRRFVTVRRTAPLRAAPRPGRNRVSAHGRE